MTEEDANLSIQHLSKTCHATNCTSKHICEFCSRKFASESLLIQHLPIHEGEKNACEVKQIVEENDVIRLAPYQPDEKSHICKTCNKQFADKNTLRQHLAIHAHEKSRVSAVSRRRFTRREINRHYLKRIGGEKPQILVATKKFTKVFISKHNLINKNITNSLPTASLLIEADEDLFACELCSKKFGMDGNLKQHMFTHTGEKPHGCNICSRQFARKNDLVRHLLTHTGEKPYTCEFCGKNFAKSSDLNRHQLIHTGQKPHVCTSCSKQFTRKDTLNHHLLTHIREKRHACDVCSKRFARKSDLNKHRLIHERRKQKLLKTVTCVDEQTTVMQNI